jgi:hypothetical protein
MVPIHVYFHMWRKSPYFFYEGGKKDLSNSFLMKGKDKSNTLTLEKVKTINEGLTRTFKQTEENPL